MDISNEPSEILPPEKRSRNKVIPGRAKEIRRVLSRLHAVLVEHVEASERLGAKLGLADLLAVISALEADADGLSTESYLGGPDEIRNYLRASLYDELRSEPSTVLFMTKVSADVTRYEAMPRDFWLDCLTQLRVDLAAMAARLNG